MWMFVGIDEVLCTDTSSLAQKQMEWFMVGKEWKKEGKEGKEVDILCYEKRCDGCGINLKFRRVLEAGETSR